MTTNCWTKRLLAIALAAGALGGDAATSQEAPREPAGAAAPAAATSAVDGVPSAAAGASGAKKHALLIGCTVYPELPEQYQLNGPANDVELTTGLLHDRFGFVDDEIVTLVHDASESMRPTHDNIVREFDALVKNVGPGDSVFILIGGHGSQVKNDPAEDPDDVELDGMDEVFLPEDVTKWDPAQQQQAVKAIRDDDIHEWLDAIRKRGASVFFVCDTCHAGTMDRGPGGGNSFSRARWVDPAVIGPMDGLPPAGQADAGRLDDASDDGGSAAGMGALVSLYAVSEHLPEEEHVMPPDNRLDGPIYGRLTYAFNAVVAGSKRALTYRELAEQIRWQYAGWRWPNVGYLLTTADELNREVLGQRVWEDRSRFTLSRQDRSAFDQWRVAARRDRRQRVRGFGARQRRG